MGHFSSVAKVAPRFGCAKQSTNLKRYLIHILHQQRDWLDGLSKFSTVSMLTFGGSVNVQKITVEIYIWMVPY